MAQSGQEFTMYHQDYIHTEQTLRPRTSRGQGDNRTSIQAGSTQPADQQTHKEQAINVHKAGENNVIQKLLQLASSLKVYTVVCGLSASCCT